MIEKCILVLILLFLQWYVDGKELDDKIMKPKAIARITKGTRASAADYPHVVQFFNENVLCGGSIITSRSILTAAHCLDLSADPQYMAVTVGATGKQIMSTKNTVPVWDAQIHVQYKENEVGYDIAMLFLNKPLKFNKVTQRAFLVDTDSFKTTLKAKYAVTGWGLTTYPDGSTSQNGLQMIYMMLIQKYSCELFYGRTLPPDIFCLYGGDGKDTCNGDSGNGVLWSGMLTGIVSFGSGCGEENVPSLFTSIYDYIEWIEKSITQCNRKLCSQNNGV